MFIIGLVAGIGVSSIFFSFLLEEKRINIREIATLRDLLKITEFELSEVEKEKNKYYKTAKSLAKQLKESEKNKPKNQELILKAVKKAMIFSHPDKGGNPNDFIAYNELYKDLRRE